MPDPRLILVFWLSVIAMPIPGFALGLSDVEVHSFLGQPLHATVTVRSAKAEDVSNLSVRLAPKAHFIRTRLSWLEQLSDLRFMRQKSSRNNIAVIQMMTETAIQEPVLSLLLELNTGKKRLFRVVTILLKPVSQADAANVLVKQGDTLWRIALKLRNSDYSMEQIMLAMQRANPDAFEQDNINSLKAGAVLRLPDVSEISTVNRKQAGTWIRKQNSDWDETQPRQLEQQSVAMADRADKTAIPPQTAEPVAELSLIAPGNVEFDIISRSGSDKNESATHVNLAFAAEELDAMRERNQVLNSRLAVLEARLSKFETWQEMLEIENKNLAIMQTNVEQADITALMSDIIHSITRRLDESVMWALLGGFVVLLLIRWLTYSRKASDFVLIKQEAVEQNDILNEVDVYLAYKLYDKAIKLLASSLEKNPERADYRAKLLSAFFATRNATAFVCEAKALKAMGSIADRYWDRVVSMGQELVPDDQLFSDEWDVITLPDDVDEVSGKLDLARAFIDMGDTEEARNYLDEVMVAGDDGQKAEAKALIRQL